MLAFVSWLVLGTLSGATALVLLADWAQALADPDPSMRGGYGLQVTIAVVAAWIFGFSLYRVARRLRAG